MDYTILWCTSCIALCLTIATTKPNNTPPHDLVRIAVKGTAIDVFPDAVQVVVKDPDTAAKRLEEKGGERLPMEANGAIVVAHKKVAYYFGTPKIFNQVNLDYKFALGDVIYIFCRESAEEVTSFVIKYKLTKHDTITMNDNIRRDVYVGEPGYYVRFPVLDTCYTCPLHPQPIVNEPGTCPECGTELAKVRMYR